MSEETEAKKTKVVDEHVGQRLRLLRVLNGLSQSQLAQSLDLTFQQVQKYEKGVNRLSATRIFECSVLFGVQPNYFFEGLSPEMASDKPSGFEIKKVNEENPFESDRNLKLVAAYESVGDDNVKEQLFTLVKALGRVEEGVAAM